MQVRITLRSRTSLPQRAPASPAYATPYNPNAPYDPNPSPAAMSYGDPAYASYPPPDMAMPVHQPPPPAYPNPHAYAPAPQQQPAQQPMYQPAYEPVPEPQQAQYDPSQQQYGGMPKCFLLEQITGMRQMLSLACSLCSCCLEISA